MRPRADGTGFPPHGREPLPHAHAHLHVPVVKTRTDQMNHLAAAQLEVRSQSAGHSVGIAAGQLPAARVYGRAHACQVELGRLLKARHEHPEPCAPWLVVAHRRGQFGEAAHDLLVLQRAGAILVHAVEEIGCRWAKALRAESTWPHHPQPASAQRTGMKWRVASRGRSRAGRRACGEGRCRLRVRRGVARAALRTKAVIAAQNSRASRLPLPSLSCTSQ